MCQYNASLTVGEQHILQVLVKYTHKINILFTKSTAAQNEVALSYHRERGLYFLAVVFTSNIIAHKTRNVSLWFILRLEVLINATYTQKISLKRWQMWRQRISRLEYYTKIIKDWSP